MGGYIVSQNMYTADDQIYANIRFGVPSAQFETAMRQLGTLGEVLGESASGQDVTEEYIDLESRLENLEATCGTAARFPRRSFKQQKKH